MRFKNKVALVTGSESGIGLSFTKLLFKEGCNLIATKFISKVVLDFDRSRSIR